MKKNILIIMIISPVLLYGANGTTPTLWMLFKSGGIWMWALLVISILSLGFIIEKLYIFQKVKLNSKGYLIKLEKLIIKKKISKVKDCLSKNSSLVCRIINTGFKGDSTKDEFENKIERRSSIEVNELTRGLNLLATIGSIAPLVGFLGTVSGMIIAFGNIAAADDVSAQLVAGGINTALVTTAFGLIVAIPSIGMYNYFMHKIDNFIADIEKIVNLILENELIK